MSADKNEILFKRFGINYNNEDEIYKKGSVLYRKVSSPSFPHTLALIFLQYELQEPKPAPAATGEEEAPIPEQKQSRSQQDKLRKLRRKAEVVIDHIDIIKDDFWERRPWILTNKPGTLPTQT